MNLGDRAIDAPAGPHLSPVQDVLALNVGQGRHTLISVQTEITEFTIQSQAPNLPWEVADACRDLNPVPYSRRERKKPRKSAARSCLG
jgi:hypothetical protein